MLPIVLLLFAVENRMPPPPPVFTVVNRMPAVASAPAPLFLPQYCPTGRCPTPRFP